MINAFWNIEFDHSCFKPCAVSGGSLQVFQTFWQNNLAQPCYQLGIWLTGCTSLVEERRTWSSLYKFVVLAAGNQGVLHPTPATPPFREQCCSGSAEQSELLLPPLMHNFEDRTFHTLARAPSSCWFFMLVKMHFDKVENTTEQCQTEELKKGELADWVG